MSKGKNTLELLFESKPRVKILKFLFRNNSASFTAVELASRIQEPAEIVRREILRLMEVGLLKVKK